MLNKRLDKSNKESVTRVGLSTKLKILSTGRSTMMLVSDLSKNSRPTTTSWLPEETLLNQPTMKPLPKRHHLKDKS
jgi:hypothetical protein